ncbi:hypothetical protein FPOA_06522 [Fusarium poae]|uniref:NACHT domain-containing protein n=1 Tax=Fusarium poae TaxID=36050 RepID=A0A1B8AZV6_FUSPO|nr:hypothetical protein FPOA_06522 [Fusarium poae]
MSGFEALGMACAVFQTISFAHETTLFCMDIYRGQKTPDLVLEENASAMVQAADRVKVYCKAAATPQEKCLIDVAQKCTSVATKLSVEVKKITELHRKGKGNLIVAARSVLQTWRKKNKLNDLDNNLRRHTETMQTLLITRICDQNEAGLLKQRQEFNNLDQELKAFISRIAEGHRKIEQLLQDEATTTRQHITNENTRIVNSVNAHITTEAKDRETREAISAQRQRFLGSFRFQEMNERMNAITHPEDACFDKILESFEKMARNKVETPLGTAESTTSSEGSSEGSSEEVDQLWNSFADWLQSDRQLFWIQGKPGSGKSTLIKYVASKDATQALLKQWNPNTRILSHFFWKLGTSLQNNIKGLYCSMLHQLLEDKNELMNITMESFPSSKCKESYHDWSVSELHDILLKVLELAMDQENLCIFIDGLDEFVDDCGQEAIMKILSNFKRFPTVKICVTSRPEPWLKEELDTVPNLKLHDLTAPDMRKWIQGRLQQFETRFASSPHFSSDLVEKLLEKAGGVFLWTRLATQSVIRGIKNKDSEEMLISRLEQLPEKLEDLYYDMWKRLGDDEPLYRKSAATYLHLMAGFKSMIADEHIKYGSAFTALQVIKMACASRPDVRGKLSTFTEDIDYEMLNVLYGTTTNQILTTCAGLLEVCSSERSSSIYERVPKIDGTVEFVHRTAYDFIVGTEAGQRIISYSEMSDCEVEVLMFHGALCWQRILHPLYNIRVGVLNLVKGLPRLLRLTSSEGDMKKVEDLCTSIKTFYVNGILNSGYGRIPQPPFASIVATVIPIFDLEVENVDLNLATTILQSIPWHNLSWDERSKIPVSGLRRLLSQGADPAAVVSYATLHPGSDGHGNRTTALWEFLYHTQYIMWRTNRQKRTTKPHIVEIAADMLRKCPRADQHGLLLPSKVVSFGACPAKIYYSYALDRRCHVYGGRILCVVSANISYLLDLMLHFLPQHEKLKLKGEVQYIQSKIADPMICLRALVLDQMGNGLKCFQIVDQHPYEGIIDTIDEQERKLRPPESFKHCQDQLASLVNAKKAMVEIEPEYVRRTLVGQGLLGTYELKDKFGYELE